VPLTIAGELRYAAVEDVARYRDALGVPLPPGLPESLLEPVRDPAGDLALRYARSHGPFTAPELAARYGLGVAVAEALLLRLAADGRLIEGEFRPGGAESEWIDPDVLRSLRRRSLAKLRQEIEPVDGDALGRFAVTWHGIGVGRRGLEPLLDAIEQLQGAAVPASVLEREILPARVEDYQPAMLDTLMAAGEVVWAGVEPLGERDGRIALYLTDHAARLRAPVTQKTVGRGADIVSYLRAHGASFFAAVHEGTGGGFPNETVDALWDLVWKGLITNDTLHPLRAYVRTDEKRGARRGKPAPFRSRRLVPRTAEGRWSLVPEAPANTARATEWATALAQQLLTRHGVVTRETVAAEAVAGGFAAVYQVLKAMEDAGRIRRGYFVAGLGAAQFAMPAALDLLRSMREVPESPRTSVLAATDPANPYGAILKWPDLHATAQACAAGAPAVSSPPGSAPDVKDVGRGPTRTVGSLVILVDGHSAAYLRRGERELLLFVSEAEPRRSQVTREVARMLMHLAAVRDEGRRGMLITDINGTPATAHPAARIFTAEGFAVSALGLQARTERLRPRGYEARVTETGGSVFAEPTSSGGRAMDENRRRFDDVYKPHQTESDKPNYDEAIEGSVSEGEEFEDAEDMDDVDPDSADADIDRDDSVTD
jgi:ATP-dependent Lhr-like helicase